MKKDKWVIEWEVVLDSVEIRDGAVRPVSKADVTRHKKRSELLLPDSYYGYCQVFGPGELTNWNYAICIPDAKSKYFGIEQFNTFTRQSSAPRGWHPDVNQRQANAAQCRRAKFFASDICTSWFFWDPIDVTNREENEFGIYIIHREGYIARVADSFGEFIKDKCLGPGIPGYDYTNDIERVFFPGEK
jgi:hypothetical protein